MSALKKQTVTRFTANTTVKAAAIEIYSTGPLR